MKRFLLVAACIAPHVFNPTAINGQDARIREEVRSLKTYPFSRPNPVPMVARDARLYPYHSFDGYTAEGVLQDWKVIVLENAYIEVFVLPEVGGKVWGARVKRTGHEFIYRNEVMKFRNIALRGPWTSGGIEFNFGVIGHTPATATPVDYQLMEHADGSVSVVVGTMDLPSRTHWRVEVRLPADRAYFETNVVWYNPTPLEHPYYNWMTAAAFARDDLTMAIPGNTFLEHSGAPRDWPVNPAGRYLPRYADNTFAGHKSYHVVGELNDFFGGYYRDDDYGFGHWSPYEEMPGQKLWLWALSREGGVWEELLTDTDGQYVEYQAGRLLVQYSPGPDINPLTQVGFEPGAADRWSETWFPLEGIGGLTDAARDGAMHVVREDGRVTVNINAFRRAPDTLRVWSGETPIAAIPLTLEVLQPVTHTIDLAGDGPIRVTLSGLGLDYHSDRSARTLSRPFATNPEAWTHVSPADRSAFEGRQLLLARQFAEAREQFTAALAMEPWHRDALLGLADLEYRRGRYEAGLVLADRARQLDAYDGRANFIAGNLSRALGRHADAREAFGWAARSMAFRSAAYVQLSELALADGDLDRAAEYAESAVDYDRYSVPARQLLVMIARQRGEHREWEQHLERLLSIDPLHHFVVTERALAGGQWRETAFRSEYPEQTLLELAIDYHRRGSRDDALATLAWEPVREHPLSRAWRAWILGNPSLLGAIPDPDFIFPYRRETLAVLHWAAEHTDHWSWDYLLALNLWARDRSREAAERLTALGNEPVFAPMYATRAALLDQLHVRDAETDLRRARALAPDRPVYQVQLIRDLQRRGRWREAAEVSAASRSQFPEDFNFDLLHVRALNHTHRADEAVAILRRTRVLPSENARESHQLYAQAHTLVALDALERGDNATARRHLETALEWPERLGQGRPYDPDERVVQYLLAVTHLRLGDRMAGFAAHQAVMDATERRAGEISRRQLLAVLSLVALGRFEALPPLANDPRPGVERLLQAMAGAVRDGVDPRAAVVRAVENQPGLFNDLAGRIVWRALRVTP